MKLVEKFVKSVRNRNLYRRELRNRGNLRNQFASFFDALPSTPPDSRGAEAFARVSRDMIHLLAPRKVISIGDVPPDPDMQTETHSFAETGENQAPGGLAAFAGQSFVIRSAEEKPPAFWKSHEAALSDCLALHVLFRWIAPGDTASDAISATEFLLAKGFEPVLRSAEDDTRHFQALFVHRDRLGAISDEMFGWIEEACGGTSQERAMINQDIPVLIPCFNNQTYCRGMIEQLRNRHFTDITLIDNASTSPGMHRFLEEAEQIVKVDRLNENLGPKDSIFSNGRYDKLPRYFCVTDPDIVFNPFLPVDFIAELIEQAKRHRVGKAGVALNIMHRQFFNDRTINLLWQEWTIWEWEERFWSHRIGTTRSNDAVYESSVDTTFAVYDKDHWSRDNFQQSLRVAGRFTAGHAPWYKDSIVPQDERNTYQNESTFSYYKM